MHIINFITEQTHHFVFETTWIFSHNNFQVRLILFTFFPFSFVFTCIDECVSIEIFRLLFVDMSHVREPITCDSLTQLTWWNMNFTIKKIRNIFLTHIYSSIDQNACDHGNLTPIWDSDRLYCIFSMLLQGFIYLLSSQATIHDELSTEIEIIFVIIIDPL